VGKREGRIRMGKLDDFLNSAEALYCLKCGCILSEEEAQRIIKRQKLIDYLVKLHMEEGK
jgi:hypothetical protein